MVAKKPDLDALIKAVAESPRRDNSAYHQAMAEAREMFSQAEAAIGGPVVVKSKAKMKTSGKYVVKWTFEKAE
jgi:hypothetical protein